MHGVGRTVDHRRDRHRAVGCRQVDVLRLPTAVGAAAAHLGDQRALLVVDIRVALLLGLVRRGAPQLGEERDQTLHEARVGLVALARRVQRLGLEHALAQRVVRVARGRADVGGAGGGGGQPALGVVGVAAQAVGHEVAVGVVAVGDAGVARAVDGLRKARQTIACGAHGVGALGALAAEHARAARAVAVGVVAEAGGVARGIEAGDAADRAVADAPGEVAVRDGGVRRVRVAGAVQVLREAGDAARGVVHVAAELGAGEPARGVVHAAGGHGRGRCGGKGPLPRGGLAERVPCDAGDERAAVPVQAREAAGGVVQVGERGAVGVADAGQRAVGVVAVAHLLHTTVGERLLLERDAPEGVAGVLGGAAAVDDFREVALAGGREVVAQRGRLAIGEDEAGRPAEQVARDGGGLPHGVGDLAGEAEAVVLGAGTARVGAGLDCGVALCVAGVAGDYALEVFCFGDGVEGVVLEGGRGVGRVRHGLDAAQAVEAVLRALVEAVGGAGQLAVGVVAEGVGLIGAVSGSREAVDVVDGARHAPGHVARAVLDLLGGAVAHAVERVAAALAAVVAPARKAMGGVVGVGEHEAAGQRHRFDGAEGLVGQRGGLRTRKARADGLGQQAVAQVIRVGGDEAVGGGDAGYAVGVVVGGGGDVAQRVGRCEGVASGVMGVARDRAVGFRGCRHQLLGVVGPLPELGLVRRRVRDGLRQRVAKGIVGVGSRAASFRHKHRQRKGCMPLSGNRLGIESTRGVDHSRR
ncbi:hypothetical protein D3C87_956630 [compost metagenome]